MFCIYCGATLPEGAKKCTLCGNPVLRPPEATAQPVSEPESESAPASETPTEPAVEDISSNSTESLSEAEPTPEAEDTPSNSPDSEDIYNHSPMDFTGIFPPAMRSATNPKAWSTRAHSPFPPPRRKFQGRSRACNP